MESEERSHRDFNARLGYEESVTIFRGQLIARCKNLYNGNILELNSPHLKQNVSSSSSSHELVCIIYHSTVRI